MNDKPGILLVLPWDLLATGGVNQVVINLARETARQGRLRPILVCNDWDKDQFQIGSFEGITKVSARLQAPIVPKRMVRNLAGFMLTMRKDVASWRRFMLENRVQVVNAHYPEPKFVLFSLLRALGRPTFRLLYSMHGADLTAINEATPTVRAMDRWMLKQADHIVCCSDDLNQRVKESLALASVPTDTVHNGIDFNELDQAKRSAFRPETGEFDSCLLSVGTYEHKKGQDVLIDAYAKLLREGLSSALVLIGRSTPYLAALRAKVRQLGLQNHVFFLPDLDHERTLAAIRKARLFVLSSRMEPFGIVLLEAAYMRTPIVATLTGGVPEVIGRYFPYLSKIDDANALAQVIDDALFNPTETERQVRLLRRRVGATFSWQQAYEKYEPLWLGGR